MMYQHTQSDHHMHSVEEEEEEHWSKENLLSALLIKVGVNLSLELCSLLG